MSSTSETSSLTDRFPSVLPTRTVPPGSAASAPPQPDAAASAAPASESAQTSESEETSSGELSSGSSSSKATVVQPPATRSVLVSWPDTTEDEDALLPAGDSASADEDSVVPPWSNLLPGSVLDRSAVRQALDLSRVPTVPDKRLPARNTTRPSYVDAALVHERGDTGNGRSLRRKYSFHQREQG
ncbi:MAG: hypothetical protein M1815_004301 [Lichina confinis]|nr:MAG: hypothetical protein M1815_004301 [Lichina confinis]